MENSFIVYYIIFILGVIVGFVYRDIHFIRQLKNLKNITNDDIGKIKIDERESLDVKNIVKLNHEIVNGINYFYIESNNTFVAQGQTLDVAAKNYTYTQGADVLGWFKHAEQKKEYCFLNNKCMEFRYEQF